jgi:hypothetical protein
MPWFILVMLFKIAFEAIRERIAKAHKAKPTPLCADCSFAHVQYAANARRAISCTFGGAVRPMKLDVLYCTDYRARDMSLGAGVIGFVHEIAPAE